MKKNYQKPTMNVVKIQHQQHLLAGSIDSVDGGDTDINYGGGSSGPARARSFDGWDDWDE